MAPSTLQTFGSPTREKGPRGFQKEDTLFVGLELPALDPVEGRQNVSHDIHHRVAPWVRYFLGLILLFLNLNFIF